VAAPRYGGAVESVTHLYTYPEATQSEDGHREVEAALAKLSTELKLPHQLRLRGGHSGRVTVPDHSPEETWGALERVVADWPQIFLPRPAG
jgi:hypothetical protein